MWALQPWAIAPTIKTTKPVATAIATFVSTDKFIIFPFNYGGNPLPRFLDFTFYFSYITSNFHVLMDARRSARVKEDRRRPRTRRYENPERKILTNVALSRIGFPADEWTP